MVNPFWLVAAAFLVGLVPLVVGLVTSYLKISIVLGFMRSGLGAQQVPSTPVIVALSLALSLIVMGPTLDESLKRAEKFDFALLQRQPGPELLTNLRPIAEPFRQFMLEHVGAREAALVLALHKNYLVAEAAPNEKLTVRKLVTAFILTELKEAFAMGFVLLLPFLVIDLVVANVLVGLGMTLLSPILISLPLKLLVFVLADGWFIVGQGLINSYR